MWHHLLSVKEQTARHLAGGLSRIRGGEIMYSEIIIAALSLAGTFVGSFSGMKLMSYRIEQLERKVDKHNNFAERIPVLEEKIKTQGRRIDEMERELNKP